MTKTLTAAALVVSSCVLAACSLPGQQAASPSPMMSAPPVADQKQGGTNMMDMAKNLMAGQGYRCTMTAKSNGQEMKYAMKGKQVAIMFTEPATKKQMNMIATQEAMYSWDPATKMGMKFPVPKAGEMEAQSQPGMPQIPDASDLKAWQDFQAKYEMNCSPAVINDSEFTPPADVKFQDLSAMMKNLPKQAP